jgi:hypothetical protein
LPELWHALLLGGILLIERDRWLERVVIRMAALAKETALLCCRYGLYFWSLGVTGK